MWKYRAFLIFQMSYRCYHCELQGSFQEVTEHSISHHREHELKFRKLILNEGSGKLQFLTQSFGIVPSKIPADTDLVIDEDALKIKLLKRQCGKVDFTPESKRVKFESSHEVGGDTEQAAMDTAELLETDDTHDQRILDELIEMMPRVIDSLKDSGHSADSSVKPSRQP